MLNSSNNTPRIGAPAYTEPVGPLRKTPSTSSSEVQPPVATPPSQSTDQVAEQAPSSTDAVRKLGVSESSPVKVSFQTPAAGSSNNIQGVRRLNSSEDILAIPDLPDLRSPEDLGDSIDLYRLACTACEEGDVEMAQDFLAWARELDPGAPDLPQTLLSQF